MSLGRAVALATALALALPGAALAQSAGDDQYRDPFGEEGQQQDQGGGDQTAPNTSGQSAPAPTPAPAPAPTTTGAERAATVAGDTLPRTGLGAGIVAALGVVMLLGGFALRRAAGRHESLR